jgi:endonuclease/exonuclease/phosphatase family metal-dependent hydrolase
VKGPGTVPQALRVATYNVHSGVGTDGRCDPARIARVINELSADVVALQEVESRHGDLETLKFLAAQTGMTAVPGPTLLRSVGDYGNALLTRSGLVALRRIDLSFPGREPRGAIDAVLSFGPARLRVIATHLGLRPAERRRQIETLLGAIDDDAMAAVLMGDLNEWFLWGRPLRRLHAHFGATPAPPTFPARWPLFALDRLWVKPRRLLDTLAVHRSPLARTASDHLPLTATIRLDHDPIPVKGTPR